MAASTPDPEVLRRIKPEWESWVQRENRPKRWRDSRSGKVEPQFDHGPQYRLKKDDDGNFWLAHHTNMISRDTRIITIANMVKEVVTAWINRDKYYTRNLTMFYRQFSTGLAGTRKEDVRYILELFNAFSEQVKEERGEQGGDSSVFQATSDLGGSSINDLFEESDSGSFSADESRDEVSSVGGSPMLPSDDLAAELACDETPISGATRGATTSASRNITQGNVSPMQVPFTVRDNPNNALSRSVQTSANRESMQPSVLQAKSSNNVSATSQQRAPFPRDVPLSAKVSQPSEPRLIREANYDEPRDNRRSWSPGRSQDAIRSGNASRFVTRDGAYQRNDYSRGRSSFRQDVMQDRGGSRYNASTSNRSGSAFTDRSDNRASQHPRGGYEPTRGGFESARGGHNRGYESQDYHRGHHYGSERGRGRGRGRGGHRGGYDGPPRGGYYGRDDRNTRY